MTMATRFAGDFFGVPLTTPGESGGSSLLAYFPELRSVKQSKTSDEGESEEARSFRGTKAVSPFVGFKTFEAPNEPKAAPVFAGFKGFNTETK